MHGDYKCYTLYFFYSFLLLFTQIFGADFSNNLIFGNQFEDDENELCIKPFKVGRGRSKTGKRAGWTKKQYFEQDLLTLFKETLQPNGFSSKFAGFKPIELIDFFEKIKSNALRPRETFFHARNKLLLWLDKNHNILTWNQVSFNYQIGIATGKGYIVDVEKAIVKTYENSNIISFPSEDDKDKMIEILKKRKAHLPTVLFTLDGKHARCSGKLHTERLSWKYRYIHAYIICI